MTEAGRRSEEGHQEGNQAGSGPGWRRRLREGETVLALLIALAVVGIGINEFSPRYALWFWLACVPAFALANLVVELPEEDGVRPGLAAVPRALAHWGGAAAALLLIYLLEWAGRINNEVAGLTALLVLALASFLAGVHGAWRFAPVGIVLAAAVAAAAFVEAYMWVGMFVGLPLALLIAWLFYQRARRSSEGAAG